MNGGIPEDGGTTAWYAHSRNLLGVAQTMQDHVCGVTKYALQFAPETLKKEAFLAGLLHDLGKYSPLFQDVLRNKASGVDHWSLGAWVALRDYRSVPVALAVQGHHIGLQQREECFSDLLPVGDRQIVPDFIGYHLVAGVLSGLVSHISLSLWNSQSAKIAQNMKFIRECFRVSPRRQSC